MVEKEDGSGIKHCMTTQYITTTTSRRRDAMERWMPEPSIAPSCVMTLMIKDSCGGGGGARNGNGVKIGHKKPRRYVAKA